MICNDFTYYISTLENIREYILIENISYIVFTLLLINIFLVNNNYQEKNENKRIFAVSMINEISIFNIFSWQTK